ncbi:MAG: hypothetical protein HY516_04280 [Candidatus Aenigmarchaeota archaeon]|nr:hypothetical protein [Candidatus Aenigmarchaeota archaeon]
MELSLSFDLLRKKTGQETGNKNLKGIMHMIEAVVAITMIMTFLLLLRSKIQTATDTGLEQAIAAQALKTADKQNLLRGYAIEEDHLGLNAQFDAVVPAEFNHTTRLCYVGDRCIGDALPDKNVFTASYVIAGNETYFKPAQILLHIWR